MHKSSIYLACLFSIMGTGCKVISKQEAKTVEALGKALTTTASVPAEYTRQYYNISIETGQVSSSMITDPSEKVESLKALISDQLQIDTIVRGYSSGYNVLTKYAELLLSLTDDTSYQKQLTKQKDAFIPAFDTLTAKYNSFNPDHKIPVTSLGGLASKIVQEIGSRRIRNLQRKYLKQLVFSADTVVAHICDQYNSIDFTQNDRRLSTLSRGIDETYKTFMKFVNLDKTINPYDYYKMYDPVYLDWKKKEVLLKELNVKTQKSMINVKATHNQLVQLLKKKMAFKDMVGSLKELYGSVNSLKESYEKFEKDLTHAK